MRNILLKLTPILLAMMLCALFSTPALAQEIDGDCTYTLYDEQGQMLTMRGGRMYVDDEYIAEDNRCYRIVSVDDAAQTATAEYVGMSEIDPAALSAFYTGAARAESQESGEAAVEENASDSKKLICMYSTHSDESYVPTDGESSKWEDAGIYDVGNSLKDALEDRGIEVIYSEDSFLPHDADAYNRSRATAEELLKEGPDALLDIHRDAIPAEQYETTVEGDDISKVRLFVGRSNQNSAANKAFAQQIKETADQEYPGLVKDIYIGRGNYNQELYPQALLLEFGTHTIEKDKAIGATEYMADVLDEVLYGESAQAEGAQTEKSSAAATGIAWAVGLAIAAALIYALISTGSFKGMWQKMKRGASEVSGGLFGDKDRRK